MSTVENMMRSPEPATEEILTAEPVAVLPLRFTPFERL